MVAFQVWNGRGKESYMDEKVANYGIIFEAFTYLELQCPSYNDNSLINILSLSNIKKFWPY